jgi:hypothetical protein
MSDPARPVESGVPPIESVAPTENTTSRAPARPGRLRRAFRKYQELIGETPLTADQITEAGLGGYMLDQVDSPIRIATLAKRGIFTTSTLQSDYARYYGTNVDPDADAKIEREMRILAARGFVGIDQVDDERTGNVQLAWVLKDPKGLRKFLKPGKPGV